ncbi:NAD(P)H-dependent oxidoreductase [Halorubraceae archaeon YAN]|nr:NAD(P)H-dependent oxidoreductase [Halorubraceae archaeon YAN]
MTGTHVVAVCGSLREQSYTRVALLHALGGADTAGATTELLDLRELTIPPLDPDRERQRDASVFKQQLRDADAILLGSPMYHGSYSGVLKNALDHCGFDEFEGKTVGLLAVSGGSFPLPTLEHLRSVCRAFNAWVLPHQAAVPRAHAAITDGEFVDNSTADRVALLGQRAVEYAHIEPDPITFESEQNVGATK